MDSVSVSSASPANTIPVDPSASSSAPLSNSPGALADLALTGTPIEQGAALRALDAQTGSRAATEALLAESAASVDQC